MNESFLGDPAFHLGNNLDMAFLRAVRDGDSRLSLKLLHDGAKPDATVIGGTSALHIAVLRRRDRLSERLLALGCPAAREDNQKRTPLHYAAEAGLSSFVRRLAPLSHIDAPDSDGYSPLAHASRNGHAGVVKLLLSFGANPNGSSETKESVSHSPLLVAAANGRASVIRVLLSGDSSSRVLFGDDRGSPLEMACCSGDTETVRELLRFGLRENGTCPSRIKSPHLAPHLAAKNGDVEMCRMLLDAGLSFYNIDNRGRSPLHYAAMRDDSNEGELRRLLSFLFKIGLDPLLPDADEETPLALASRLGCRFVFDAALAEREALALQSSANSSSSLDVRRRKL